MPEQTAQDHKVNTHTLLPFLVLGVLIIVGVFASILVSKNKQSDSMINNQNPTQISVTDDSPLVTEKSAAEKGKIPISLVLNTNNPTPQIDVVVSPSSEPLNDVISYAFGITSSSNAIQDPIMPEELEANDWGFLIAKKVTTQSTPTVRIAAIRNMQTPFSISTETVIASIPLSSTNGETVNFSLEDPTEATIFDREGMEYNLELTTNTITLR